ncbi:MAG TPA: nucleotidyltransferase domain-containing protein [Phycisphaerales bacterium]|nr:nucleotidyltransferase domain-containing protein [Phycisphaerales bacterium]
MIDISPEQKDIIHKILEEHIPDRKVMAFGSRTSPEPKSYSDLDLAIMGDKVVDFGTLALLKDAFAESDLPFRVDLIQWCRTSPEFRKVIEPQLKPIDQSY